MRKTAAICVVKLHDISPNLVQDQGFIESLEGLLSDGNPMVVSNSVAALQEISSRTRNKPMHLTCETVLKLLAVLNDASEWGTVYILDALAGYRPTSSAEAESILDRVKPRLQHANSAVVLSATKVMMKCLDYVDDEDKRASMVKALSPPLVTLMSGQPQIQYVALRNIQLICQKRPAILHGEVKVFFCRYNDPIYVKMEKLDVLVMLTSERTVDQTLAEFKEYATEIDCEFVCKAVRCIGRTAIKLEAAAERCVNVLVSLIETKVNYVVQGVHCNPPSSFPMLLCSDMSAGVCCAGMCYAQACHAVHEVARRGSDERRAARAVDTRGHHRNARHFPAISQQV